MAFEVVHRDESLDRLERDAKFNAGYSTAVVRAFRKRMWVIRNATDERDLREVKSNHFEKLKGNRGHQHSMRLNDQWRLIIEIEGKGPNKKLIVVGIEDYH
jgi:proteic killer suppression protein